MNKIGNLVSGLRSSGPASRFRFHEFLLPVFSRLFLNSSSTISCSLPSSSSSSSSSFLSLYSTTSYSSSSTSSSPFFSTSSSFTSSISLSSCSYSSATSYSSSYSFVFSSSTTSFNCSSSTNFILLLYPSASSSFSQLDPLTIHTSAMPSSLCPLLSGSLSSSLFWAAVHASVLR